MSCSSPLDSSCLSPLPTDLPVIAVYDFDSTIFSQDVDSVALEMHEELIGPLSQKNYPVWTDYMSACLANLHTAGVTPEALQQRLRNYPLNPGMAATIRAFAAAGVPQFILSDANTLLISAVLAIHGLKRFFPDAHVLTNHAVVDRETGLITLHYHHRNVWSSRSPKNMCKGVGILSLWSRIASGALPVPAPRAAAPSEDRDTEPFDMRAPRAFAPGTSLIDAAKFAGYQGHTAYFGDGGNDFLPCAQLGPRDWVCARRGYVLEEWIDHGLGRAPSPYQRTEEEIAAGAPEWPRGTCAAVAARVMRWGSYTDSTGAELRAIVEEVVRETRSGAAVWWDGLAPVGLSAATATVVPAVAEAVAQAELAATAIDANIAEAHPAAKAQV